MNTLVPGALVVVVAPSGPVDPALLDAGVARLESWGLRVTVAPHVRSRLGYLAGPDAERAGDLTTAWSDPQVSAVLCARGGYGAQRILDLLGWDRIRAGGAKVFVGSSDTTVLHQALARRLGLATYYGPMVATPAFTGDGPSASGLRQALFQGIEAVSAPAGSALVPGRAEGVLHGGNLTMLATGIGTADGGPPPGPRVVFLEDVNEAPYRLDRCLTQLLRTGWLQGVAGVALGTFVGCGDPGVLQAMLAERLAPLGVPVLWGVPAGHGAVQQTLPFGVPVRLDADDGTVTVRR